VSNDHALLLSSGGQLRYLPDGNNGEFPTFTYRAWDQTSGAASTNGVPRYADTGSGGGTTAFSSATGSVIIAVTSVNDAPSLNGSAAFTPIDEDATNSNGDLVSNFASVSTDVDTGALKGLAITSVDNSNGTWEYTLNGTTWFAIGMSPPAAPAFCRPTLAPASASFQCKLERNDRDDDVQGLGPDERQCGGLADVTVNGGTTAFSVGTSGAPLS